MAVYVDLICSKCGTVFMDRWSTEIGETHAHLAMDIDDPNVDCEGTLERLWTMTMGLAPGTHPSEKVVVYQSAAEGGKLQYPMRNDAPMPDRLKRRGYERVELNVRDLASFERRHGVVNERRHYDRNGRGHDG